MALVQHPSLPSAHPEKVASHWTRFFQAYLSLPFKQGRTRVWGASKFWSGQCAATFKSWP